MANSKKKNAEFHKTRNWVIVCNGKDFDIDGAFENLKYVDWHQPMKECFEGDLVYIYVYGTYDAIRFITRIVKRDKPTATIDDGPYVRGADGDAGTAPFMELAPVMQLDPIGLDAQSIWDHGYTGILRGPVHATEELERFIAFRAKMKTR